MNAETKLLLMERFGHIIDLDIKTISNVAQVSKEEAIELIREYLDQISEPKTKGK